jgi:hypothetical protein
MPRAALAWVAALVPAAALAWVAALVPAAALAQGGAPAAPPRDPVAFVPLALSIGIPQGDFAENVDITGGVSGGLLFRLSGFLALRADLGVMIYGSETRRVPLGTGPLGRITVDVTTTNTIFDGGVGLQLGVPGRRVMPYLGGTIGFAGFTTTSSVKGSNSSDEEFASSENYSDWAFSKNALAGINFPFRNGQAAFDLGALHLERQGGAVPDGGRHRGQPDGSADHHAAADPGGPADVPDRGGVRRREVNREA